MSAELLSEACTRCGRNWLSLAAVIKGERECPLASSRWCLARLIVRRTNDPSVVAPAAGS